MSSDRGKCKACETCEREGDCYYSADDEGGPGGCRSWYSLTMAEQVCGSLHVKNAYVVIAFSEAPYVLRQLSRSGGDEDFITVFKRADVDGYVPSWLDNMGCCSNDCIQVGPFEVWIASHA